MARKRPALKAIRNIAQAAITEVEKLTPDQRKEMRTALHGLTQTNCWWAEYDLRGALLGIVETAIHDDDLAAKQRKAKPPKVSR